ncbi:uncharacterized protein LOC109709194 [Ananas comosus]|uniref:Uncharacterized protein LOC109706571 n=1 Tax=Ananas comosus TaxID=4615 RepID=A0A6P5EHZ2_ANACO|nr:uncharacterized protein LOC109706571 [Ananas comosus]XP_020086886.1 uncharacterized protein LOC109709194 [Ananas comosus]
MTKFGGKWIPYTSTIYKRACRGFYKEQYNKITSLSLSLSLSLSPCSPTAAAPMASSTMKRWLRPEVYPLFAAVGTAVGICGMQLIRNITTNPEVRVTKQNRAAGVLENFVEGERYAEHGLRKFVRNKSPEIMPSVNGYFSNPK